MGYRKGISYEESDIIQIVSGHFVLNALKTLKPRDLLS
jgi:hypothetical protein